MTPGTEKGRGEQRTFLLSVVTACLTPDGWNLGWGWGSSGVAGSSQEYRSLVLNEPLHPNRTAEPSNLEATRAAQQESDKTRNQAKHRYCKEVTRGHNRPQSALESGSKERAQSHITSTGHTDWVTVRGRMQSSTFQTENRTKTVS